MDLLHGNNFWCDLHLILESKDLLFTLTYKNFYCYLSFKGQYNDIKKIH